MSVINQMLRDLDQRQASQPASQPVAPMMRQQQSKRPILIISGLVIIGLVTASVYFYSPSNQMQPSAELMDDQSPLSVVEKSTADKASVVSQETEQPISSGNEASETELLQTGQIETVPVEVTEMMTDESIAVTEDVAQVETIEDKAVITSERKVAPDEITPRVVKSNPNQTNRVRAEALYKTMTEADGIPLSKTQYREILAIDPSLHQIRIESLTQLAQSNSDEFVTEVTSAIESWPEVYQYRQMLARQWVTSDPKRAYELLLQQMPTIDKAPDYHGLIAYSAQQMGELTLATKKYELLLQSFPERADWWFALALLQEQLGVQGMALAAYQQSLRFPGLTTTTRDYAQQRVRAIQGY